MSNKIPFDLAESESELVAGYHTEYSGLYWAWLMVAEYAILLLMALIGVMLFLGGWNSPFPNLGPFKAALYTNGIPGTGGGIGWSLFWLFAKTAGVVGSQMWIKWSLPRLRPSQLLLFCWFYLIPLGLLTLLATIWWQFFIL
jgi:NADH-quinone oxidoreductase subunit H